jgi:hypothetical protein
LQDHVLGFQALLQLAHLMEAFLESGLRLLQLGDVRPRDDGATGFRDERRHGHEEDAFTALGAAPNGHLAARRLARQHGLDAGQELGQPRAVRRWRAAGLEVVLALRGAGGGTFDAGGRRRPGFVHGGDEPPPIQHRDGARDRAVHRAVEGLRLAQTRLRPRPVDRAGENAGHQLQPGEEVGREIAVPVEGGDPQAAHDLTVDLEGQGDVGPHAHARHEGELAARLLRKVLGEALEDDPSPAMHLLRIPGQGSRHLEAELRRPNPRPRVAVRGRVRRRALRELVDAATIHVQRLHEPPERLADRIVQLIRGQSLETQGQVREEGLKAEPLPKLVLGLRYRLRSRC